MLNIKERFERRMSRWTRARTEPGNTQLLTAKNIYIFPSAYGFLYGVVLFTLLFAAVRYQLSIAFLFVFFLIVIGLMCTWESHRNVVGLSIRILGVNDAPVGVPAMMTLFIQGQNAPRLSLIVAIKNVQVFKIDELPKEGLQIKIPINTSLRGRFKTPRLTICSYFPLGIFRVWGYALFDNEYYVYPQPISPGFWPKNISEPNQLQQKQIELGDEELYELKAIDNPWVQPERIAWKLSAKGQGWLLQTLTSPTGENWLFRLEDLPNINLENSLQQLSYWLQNAEQQSHLYGLQLGAQTTDISHGQEHLKHCLRQLAVY